MVNLRHLLPTLCAALLAAWLVGRPAAAVGFSGAETSEVRTGVWAPILRSADARSSPAGLFREERIREGAPAPSGRGQTTWSPLPALDSYTSPALSAHSDGRIYAVAVAFNGLVAYTSTGVPDGWGPWKILGPEPGTIPLDPAFYADPKTPPVLVRDGNTLRLFVRGRDDNLYETHKVHTGDWSDWKAFTTDGRVRGRISVAITDADGSSTIHVLHASEDRTVEYRSFDPQGTQVGPVHLWKDAWEGTVATDGVNEVWVVIRTDTRRLLVEKKNRPWSSPWHPVTSRLADGNQGEIVDLSNMVFFAGAYHVAYSARYRCDDVSPIYCRALFHTRIRAGLSDDGYIRTLAFYSTSQSHPQATLLVYRNRLVMAYRDEQGWVRYARWDSADPTTPWVPTPGEKVASGRTYHRPALATFDTGLPSRWALTRSANDEFGNDLIAAITTPTDEIAAINFSRAVFKQYLEAIGVQVAYTLDDPPPTAAAFRDRLYLFLMGRDRNVWFKSSRDGQTWDARWTELGGSFGNTAIPKSPAAAVFNGKLYVFIIHWDDGQIHVRSSPDGRSWSSWAVAHPLPNNLGASTGPIATVFRGRLHLFVLASDGRVYTAATADGAQWSSWSQLPALPQGLRHEPAGTLGGVQAFGDRLYLFTRIARPPSGGTGSYETKIWYIRSETDGDWSGSGWQDLGIHSPSDPEALVFQGKLHVFVRDRWNTMWANRLDATWSGWTRFPGASGASGLTPSGPTGAVFQNRLHLFVRGMDYEILGNVSGDGVNWPGWQPNPPDAPSRYGPFQPEVENLPGFTEAGYAFWMLPHWMMGHIMEDYVASTPAGEHQDCALDLLMRAGAHVSGKYQEFTQAHRYPVWIDFNAGARIWCGDHINYRNTYRNGVWDEIGHTLAGAIGIYDGAQNPKPWQSLEPGIPQAAVQEALTIFGQPCPSGQDASGRPRGFTRPYGCTSRQHSWMYPLIEYFSNGDQLRSWIADDRAMGQTEVERELLGQKYDWIRRYIFRGVEFRSHGEPWVPPANDVITRATVIQDAPFIWVQDVETASLDPDEPTPACGNGRPSRAVWFRHVPPEDSILTASTDGSDFDTVLAAWTERSGALVALTCNDDVEPGDRTSEVTVVAQAGVPVYFQVASPPEGAEQRGTRELDRPQGTRLVFQLEARGKPRSWSLYLPFLVR